MGLNVRDESIRQALDVLAAAGRMMESDDDPLAGDVLTDVLTDVLDGGPRAQGEVLAVLATFGALLLRDVAEMRSTTPAEVRAALGRIAMDEAC